MRTFIDLSSVILEAHDSGIDVLRMIERRIAIERLRTDRDRARGIARPTDAGHLDLLIVDGPPDKLRALTPAVVTESW